MFPIVPAQVVDRFSSKIPTAIPSSSSSRHGDSLSPPVSSVCLQEQASPVRPRFCYHPRRRKDNRFASKEAP